MSDDQLEQEPSIEEILNSIRQIISDDDEEEVATPAAEEEATPESAPEPEPVAEEAPAPEPEPEPTPEPEEDVVDLVDVVEEPAAELEAPEDIEIDLRDIEPEPTPEPEISEAFEEPAPRPQAQPSSMDSILTDGATAATMGAFTELAKTAMVERAGQVTIEDVVRHEVKPLLTEWLDKNLPDIVERLLEKELQRISSRYLDD